MRRIVASALAFLVLCECAWAGLGSSKAMYVGGTAGIKDKTEGKASLTDEKAFSFNYGKASLSIPYSQITSLEYGQKAGRRVGLAVAVSPLFLFSKKRRHFLTIGYTDDAQKQQAAVFELGKGGVRSTLATLEQRTGKKVEFEDDEARKTAEKN